MPRFYVGQPVICVNDELRPHVVARFPGLTWPRAGQRYTIRANIISRGFNFVLLREISNRKILYPRSHRYAEAGFWEERFEPATDISALERQRITVGAFMDGKAKPDWDRRRAPRPVRKREDA